MYMHDPMYPIVRAEMAERERQADHARLLRELRRSRSLEVKARAPELRQVSRLRQLAGLLGGFRAAWR